ncbi:MAG: hypothetical protein J5640_02910 [Bacteroidales bacterium]|nr:hypothetical protein [Bacteroidales bacterium]
MKKIIAFTIAALSLLAVSCNKEVAPETGKMVTKTFTVNAPDTKTELSGTKSVVWSTGDEINVIAKTSGKQYTFTLTEGAGTANAKFSGSIADTDASETEFYALYPNVAIRPEETDTKGNRWALDLGQLVIDQVVTTQEAVEAGFPTAGAFMTAVADAASGNVLSFRHGAAYLKITMAMDDIKAIHVEVSGGARLGGRPIYTMSTGATFQVNGAKNFMDFTCSGGFKNGSTYYLPVLTKQSNCGDLKLTFTRTDDTAASITTKSLTSVSLASGKIYDLGSPTVSFEPEILVDDMLIEADKAILGQAMIPFKIVNPIPGYIVGSRRDAGADWLMLHSNDYVDMGTSGNLYFYTTDANTGTEPRSATITFTYYNASDNTQIAATATMTLTQAAPGAAASHTYTFYIDNEKNVVQTQDGQAGTYFTVTGTSILDCSASGYFAVDSFTILGNTYSHAMKIDGSNNVSFTTHSSAATTIRFFAAKRQSNKDGVIKLQKGSSNIVNATMTLGTIYDSGVVNLDKGTDYKFNKSGEVGLFYIEVVETF